MSTKLVLIPRNLSYRLNGVDIKTKEDVIIEIREADCEALEAAVGTPLMEVKQAGYEVATIGTEGAGDGFSEIPGCVHVAMQLVQHFSNMSRLVHHDEDDMEEWKRLGEADNTATSKTDKMLYESAANTLLMWLAQHRNNMGGGSP